VIKVGCRRLVEARWISMKSSQCWSSMHVLGGTGWSGMRVDVCGRGRMQGLAAWWSAR
jgi:hypothetical protein